MQQLKLSKNIGKLHSLFGKKLYSDKFSFLSEICQNAVDSHRMAKVDKPVIIGIKEMNSGYSTLYIKDIGLSFVDQQDFIDKVCTILESGKSYDKTSEEDCPMGMHGVGSISVSAFQSSWRYRVVTPTKNCFKVDLMEVEGSGLNYNIKDLGAVDEEKSVLFEVDFNNNEIHNLMNAFQRKLLYFRDLHYEFDVNTSKKVNINLLNKLTNYKIVETDDFIFSTMNSSSELKICLDQYIYDIKWDKLGTIPILPTNIALKFNMNEGLEADLTRENLVYDENYKQIILNKIKKVSHYLVEKYNEKFPTEGIEDLQALYNELIVNGNHRIVTLTPELKVEINPFINFCTIKPNSPSFKNIPDAILRKFLDSPQQFIKCNFYISSSGRSQPSFFTKYNFFNEKIIELDEILTPKKLKYIKSAYHDYMFISYEKTTLKNLKSYYPLKTAKSTYRSTGVNFYREVIKHCKKLVDEYFIQSNTLKASQISIPSSFMPKKSFKKSTFDISQIEGKIPVKKVISSLGWTAFYITADDIKSGKKIYYCTDSTKDYLHKRVLLNQDVYLCSNTQAKKFEKLKVNYKNIISMDEFEIKDLPNISLFGSFYKHKELFHLIMSSASIFNRTLFDQCKDFKKDFHDLEKQASDCGFKNCNNNLGSEIYQICVNNKLFDKSLEDKIQSVDKFSQLMSFIARYDKRMVNIANLALSEKYEYDTKPIELYIKKF